MSTDIAFVVTVKDVPDGLADLIRAYIGMHLDVVTSEMARGIDEADLTVHGKSTSNLSDEEWDAIANLATDVSEVLS